MKGRAGVNINFSENDKNKMRAMKKKGLYNKEIARTFNCSSPTIAYHLNKQEEKTQQKVKKRNFDYTVADSGYF